MNDQLKDRIATASAVMLAIGVVSANIIGVATKNPWIFVPSAIALGVLFACLSFDDAGEGGEH